MRHRNQLRHFICFLCITGLIAIIGFCMYNFLHPRYRTTELFILNHMQNANGSLATYLNDTPQVGPDVVHGREALSESLGLWMQYSLDSRNRELFDRSWELLNQHFLSRDGYVYWKLAPDGQQEVTTNALIDDLRIMNALLTATDLWGTSNWDQTAKKIGQTLVLHTVNSGYLVDFYDSKYRNSSNTITLSYLNPRDLQKLTTLGLWHPSDYERHIALLRDYPHEGIFFPKSFHVPTATYRYDANVNMIDQLLVALHRQYAGYPSPEFYQFLRSEYYQHGQIYGEYNRTTQTSDTYYESIPVYALTILYALEQKDLRFAMDIYKRQLTFRSKADTYTGGYLLNGQAHIFDNLFPLLAETALYRANPLYFLFHRETDS
ncbi:MAG TPA: glycosyl hydrolase [Patescibacteria group bacterium]|nr:glycosyl hydrolase [Patescibacteria group bacterium]